MFEATRLRRESFDLTYEIDLDTRPIDDRKTQSARNAAARCADEEDAQQEKRCEATDGGWAGLHHVRIANRCRRER